MTPVVSSLATLSRLQYITSKFADEGAIRFRGYGSAVVSDVYHALEIQATNEDLVILTNFPEPAVRCYAFMALVERGDTSAFHILMNHIDDSDNIEVSGCTIEEMSCAAFFLKNIFSAKNLLNTDQIAQLDSILIFTQPVLLTRGRSQSLILVSPKQSYYEQIRRIVTKEQDPAAAIALSKYHRKHDRIIIRKVLAKKSNASFVRWLHKNGNGQIP